MITHLTSPCGSGRPVASAFAWSRSSGVSTSGFWARPAFVGIFLLSEHVRGAGATAARPMANASHLRDTAIGIVP